MTVHSATQWPNNSDMIAACKDLGYLDDSYLTLDPTYGKGNFYKSYRPPRLIAGDLITRAPMKLDFRKLPFADKTFNAVVFDGPYKLNGTPSIPDIPYGVDIYTRWQDRMRLLELGQIECARVVKKKGYLLTKCMDQVVSGQVRFQTDILTSLAIMAGLRKVDELQFLTNPREQPHSRQVHSRRNYSTLLIFQRD